MQDLLVILACLAAPALLALLDRLEWWARKDP